jgi:hypothetical protein
VSSLRFVVGRLARHVLRPDTIEGVLGDDAGGAQQAGSFALRRQPGGRLGLEAPGADVLSISPDGAQVIAQAGPGAVLLVGWPEEVLVIRRGGAVIYGEGDIVHFGDLPLDPLRTLRRIGFDYLAEQGADVRVTLELDERGDVDVERALKRGGFLGGSRPDTPLEASVALEAAKAVSDTRRLAPGEQARFGPYELSCERAYDFERRHIAGEMGHAYFFKLRRQGEDPVGLRPAGLPDPFAVTQGLELVTLARRMGLLDADEVLTGEPALAEWISAYEGPRGALEKELRAAGPSAPQLRWRGDVLEAHAARLARGDGGAPSVSRAVISLAPVGLPRVSRSAGTLQPGRMRRPRPPTAQ